ncbi:N-acetylneuraminate lyase [Jannaschia aquimarina]|uniref:NanA protein n=1 Tax=Jannaschia aquimarina TaxID=935700 RepID=A0A0D1EBA3_9RHOB|nr:N-acetylneuraminate lyase [Jannaschia aquimarina]KIT15029.1 N-acetylneuraminate lyase [Jannaschia aquimarina]SNS62313.1 N-acetylneuraminate lyase [Jannaschia aquimarina]
MNDLNGYFAALPTPFTDRQGAIAEGSLDDLVERLVTSHLSGLYVGGSTGEAFLLSEQERAALLRRVARTCAGRSTLIAHVGDPDPALSGRLARLAAEAGYDAVSAVPPFYYRYGFEEILRHYEWLAGQTDLPFLIYNFPALSGVHWSADQIAQLCDLPNVVGVKNTCGDLFAFESLRRLRPEARLFHGFDETLLAGLSMGADGGIGSTYNIQPDRIVAIDAAFRAGDMDTARSLQADANALIEAMVAAGVIPALKYLLTRSGIPMGDCRPPFGQLDADARAALDAAADRYIPAVTPNGTDIAAEAI